MDVYLSPRKTHATDSPQVPGSSPKTKCRVLKVDQYNYHRRRKSHGVRVTKPRVPDGTWPWALLPLREIQVIAYLDWFIWKSHASNYIWIAMNQLPPVEYFSFMTMPEPFRYYFYATIQDSFKVPDIKVSRIGAVPKRNRKNEQVAYGKVTYMRCWQCVLNEFTNDVSLYENTTKRKRVYAILSPLRENAWKLWKQSIYVPCL